VLIQIIRTVPASGCVGATVASHSFVIVSMMLTVLRSYQDVLSRQKTFVSKECCC